MDSVFKKWCENEAIKWRHQLNLYAYERLSAETLANHLEIAIVDPAQIPGLEGQVVNLLHKDGMSANWSAVTLPVPGYKPIIIYNPLHTQTRYESSVMHELAHILLKHKPIGISVVPEVPILRQSFSLKDEKEAEFLGSCLQIPKRALDWAFGRQMSLEEVAEHFGASLKMVRFRCNMTGHQR